MVRSLMKTGESYPNSLSDSISRIWDCCSLLSLLPPPNQYSELGLSLFWPEYVPTSASVGLQHSDSVLVFLQDLERASEYSKREQTMFRGILVQSYLGLFCFFWIVSTLRPWFCFFQHLLRGPRGGRHFLGASRYRHIISFNLHPCTWEVGCSYPYFANEESCGRWLAEGNTASKQQGRDVGSQDHVQNLYSMLLPTGRASLE